MTSMRRNDVASKSFRRHVPNRFLINQCKIITFLILKYDILENSRIELRGIVLPVQVGGLLGGPKGMLAPPLKLLGGACPSPPPSSYAYVDTHSAPLIGPINPVQRSSYSLFIYSFIYSFNSNPFYYTVKYTNGC